jgi:UDP-N-acetylglucosamine diphosphorylase/glucosamine-1-phosphate N-acetyltransferase
MKAAILAAGEGVRLLPITANRPKHLIEVGGKPILDRCFDAVKSCGITEAVVVTHYKGDAIRHYFGDGSKFDLRIEYVEQPEVLGTGNAVGMIEPYVDSEFVLLYGDLLFAPEALKRVIDSYRNNEPSVSMAVVPVENPESYGILELENEKFVKRVIEKPSKGETSSNLANAGIYVLSKAIFEKIRQTKASVRGEWEITDALSLLVAQNKKVVAVQISKEDWLDIGKPWDLLDANAWALKRMHHNVYGNVEEGAHLLGQVTVAKNARVRSGAYIEGPAFIGENSDVGPNCYIRPSTSLGKNVRVGNACEVKNSIIMDGTHIGHLSYVGDSILCDHCNLGAGTITANYRLDAGNVKMMIKNKIVDSGRRKLGVVFGDNVKTGINALFMPGVKVGNDSWVGPNVTVKRDLPPNSIMMLMQDEEKRRKK